MDESSPPNKQIHAERRLPRGLEPGTVGVIRRIPVFCASQGGPPGGDEPVSAKGRRLFTQLDEASPGIAGGHLG